MDSGSRYTAYRPSTSVLDSGKDEEMVNWISEGDSVFIVILHVCVCVCVYILYCMCVCVVCMNKTLYL